MQYIKNTFSLCRSEQNPIEHDLLTEEEIVEEFEFVVIQTKEEIEEKTLSRGYALGVGSEVSGNFTKVNGEWRIVTPMLIKDGGAF